MLKIKDDIDLQILKKYGLKKKPKTKNTFYKYCNGNELIVIEDNKEVWVEYLGNGLYGRQVEMEALDILYKLIKDDLIEIS